MRKVPIWAWVAAGVGAYFLLKPSTAIGAPAGPIPIQISGPGVIQFTGKYAASPTGYAILLPAGASWVGVNGVPAQNTKAAMFYPAGTSPRAVFSWTDSTGTEQTTTIV